MRKTLLKFLAAASVFAVAAGVSAQAADLPEGPMVPAYSWSGFYTGVHAGAIWGEYDDEFGFLDTFGDDDDEVSALFGIQAGYNWQVGSFVLGVEADISAIDLNDSAEIPGLVSASVESNWLATVRGRVGYSFDRFMVYATGGLAVTDVDAEVSPIFFANSHDNQTLFGWTVGGGVEAMITPNLSAKLEYLYVDFNEEDFTFFGGLDVEADLDAHIVRAGLNYKFNW